MSSSYFENTEIDSDPIFVDYKDIKEILIVNIPTDVNFEIVDILDEMSVSKRLEGIFSVKENTISVRMYHNWYRKYWDYPLGLKYHMDLMKRLLEFRGEYYNDTVEIEFEDEGDWCHLYYDFIIPKKNIDTLYEVFIEALTKYNWVEEQVFNVQDRIFKLLNEVHEQYNVYKLVEIPELYDMADKEENSQVKGAILEELVSRLLSNIDGFTVKERVRTETEEIDLVIRNQSNNITWARESALILVECKNWSTKIGKNEFVVFRSKINNRNSRAKIGILVSWNGFSSTVSLEDMRNCKDDIVIIKLDKNNIKDMIADGNYLKQLTEFYFDALC